MDTYPITARSLGLYFKVDGNNLERAYKDHLSGFRNWEQASHAEDWVLHPKNIGKRLGIDETMLHKDLMTFLTNKEGHGKRHTLIAAVKESGGTNFHRSALMDFMSLQPFVAL